MKHFVFDFDSICARFLSGNSIPVERARVTRDELVELKIYATRHRSKLERRIALLKSMNRDSDVWDEELAKIDNEIPQIKKDMEPALRRNDNTAKRNELLAFLHLIWRIQNLCSLIKVYANTVPHPHTWKYEPVATYHQIGS